MIIAVEIKNFKTGKVMVLHCLACFDVTVKSPGGWTPMG